MKPFSAEAVRKDFPIFSRPMNGKPLVYLDSAATTQKPARVIEALDRFYRESNANIHRGVYTLAEDATERYETARKRVAKFINAPTEKSVVFTRNTTESINLVAHSWARKFLKAGDEILLTDMEHHANTVPWYLLAQEKGVRLKSAPLTPRHTLDMEAFEKLLTPAVKLVAVTAMSNVLGTFNPIEEIVRLARKNGSFVLVDGAQSVPHGTTDVRKMGCDFLAFSAHKMLGPTGVGVLWAKSEILETMDPFLGGGEMISTVRLDKITWAEPPLKFEAGTSNYADVAVFSEAIDYLENLGQDAVRDHERRLVAYALKRLGERDDLEIFGPRDPSLQGGVISFRHKIVHAHDIGTILSDQGVAVRVGHHCAQPLMRALGVAATVRASFYVYSTEADVDALMDGLKQVDRVFRLEAAPK